MQKDIFLVDADDTLLDFHASSKLSLKQAFLDCGIPFQEEYLQTFSTFNAGLWQRLERKELTRSELMSRRFPMYLQLLGITDVSGEEFNNVFLKNLSTKPIYMDGAEEFLQTLNQMGEVYIVTNGTAWIQKSRFDIVNLWQYAKDVFVSDLIGFDKPAKEYTDYVLAHIPNFDKSRAVWIGDSLSADIKAASDSNIDSIWFNPHQKPLKGSVKPTCETNSFDEILNILAKKWFFMQIV